MPSYNERTAGERVNGRLKDEFGGRHVRVRGAAKVMCHCMFGVLALTADHSSCAWRHNQRVAGKRPSNPGAQPAAVSFR